MIWRFEKLFVNVTFVPTIVRIGVAVDKHEADWNDLDISIFSLEIGVFNLPNCTINVIHFRSFP